VRQSAALALFLLVNISAGSYFNASMPPYLITAVLLMLDKSEKDRKREQVVHQVSQ
jgi:thiosulfate dehydrogenase [quinone] large subunit